VAQPAGDQAKPEQKGTGSCADKGDQRRDSPWRTSGSVRASTVLIRAARRAGTDVVRPVSTTVTARTSATSSRLSGGEPAVLRSPEPGLVSTRQASGAGRRACRCHDRLSAEPVNQSAPTGVAREFSEPRRPDRALPVANEAMRSMGVSRPKGRKPLGSP
jgi:hypothetical protein